MPDLAPPLRIGVACAPVRRAIGEGAHYAGTVCIECSVGAMIARESMLPEATLVSNSSWIGAGRRSTRAVRSGRPRVQLHLDLVASVKLLTELTTLAALVAIAASWVAEGLDGSALTALWSASTDVLTAVV